MNYGYLRLSTSEDKQGNSFEVQKQHISAKYKVDKFFSDTLSGSTPFDERNGWVELMQYLKKGDKIICHRMDRISRNTLNFLVAEKQLKKMGINLIFIEGASNEDTAEAQLMRNMLLIMGEFERAMISTRIKQTKQKQKAEGKFLGGAVPYGFSRDEEALIENEKEQAIIKVMKGLRLKGLSYSKIAVHLNDNLYESRTKNKWNSMQISRAINHAK